MLFNLCLLRKNVLKKKNGKKESSLKAAEGW
jgi:hypothetical protein